MSAFRNKENQTKIKDFQIFKLQCIGNPEETYFVVKVISEPASMMAKHLQYRFKTMDDAESVCNALEPTKGTLMDDFGCHPIVEDICTRFPIARWSPRFNTSLCCFN